MFKYLATYKNPFTNEEENEDLYFHLIAPELAEFELTFENGFRDYVKKTLSSGDNLAIYGMFLKLISISYGRRSEDGKKFIKNPEWTKEFLSSPAWEELFFWLTDDPDGKGTNANTFWLKIMPERLLEKANEKTGKKIEDLSRDELLELLESKPATDLMPQLADK